MGVTLFYAFIIVMSNLVVDIAYGLVDPRIRASQ
jgi:ABC-type dipeptide/oligopeptide/nickel transport system permease component